MSLPRTTYSFVLVGAILWCGLILLAPYLAASSSPFAQVMYRAFHSICHQLTERSFHILGEKLAVCSRCASIYFAFLFGALVYPLVYPSIQVSVYPSRFILVTALLPMLVDVGLDTLGIHESTLVTRTLTGIVFGIVIPFVILPAAIEGVQQIFSQRKITITQT